MFATAASTAAEYAASFLAQSAEAAPGCKNASEAGLPGSGEPALLLDVRVREAAGLVATLELIARCYSDTHVCIEVMKGQGLQVRAVDQAKCSFADAFFPSTAPASIFSRFHCAEPYFPIWVSPSHLTRAVKSATHTSTSTARSAGSNYNLHLQVTAAQPDRLLLLVEALAGGGAGGGSGLVFKSSRHGIAMLTPTGDGDETSCFVDGDAFEFTAECLMEWPQLLAEVLLDVNRSGCEEVQLQLAAGWLALEGAAGDCCSQLRVALRPGGAAERAMALHAPHGPVSASFKVRHLQRLGPLCKHSQQLLLQLGPDAPLSAAFALRHGGAVQLFVAPVLGGEEEGEAGEGQQEREQGDEEAAGYEGNDVEDAEAQVVRPKAQAKAPQERKKPAMEVPGCEREAQGQQRQQRQEDMGVRDQVLGSSSGGEERVVKRRAVDDGQQTAADKQVSTRKAAAAGFPAAPPMVGSPRDAYAILTAPEMQGTSCAGGSGALGSAARSAATGAAASSFAARCTPPTARRSVGAGVSTMPEPPGAPGARLLDVGQQQQPSTVSTPATRAGAVINKGAAVAEDDGVGAKVVVAGGEGRRRSSAGDWGLGAGGWGWEAGVGTGETTWYSEDEADDGGEGVAGQEDELWLGSARY